MDNFRGAYEVVEHLIQMSYRRIAHLANGKYLSITIERLQGFEKALQDHQIEVSGSYIQYCPHGGSVEKEIEKALDAILSLKKKPE